MSVLDSFENKLNVAVIGASGGIGSAFTRLLAGDDRLGHLYALSRSGVDTDRADDRITTGSIDIEDEDSIRDAADAIEEDLDLVLVLTGILHDGDSIAPERRLKELSPEALERVLRINAVGPAIVAKHFVPKLRRKTKTVFAALSARVGSIGDNRLGGWASYRASKAALNQLLRTIAIEQTRRHPNSIVVGLHPGTVDTPLSKPFTDNTPDDKLFSAEQSAGYLLKVIDDLIPSDSGGLFAYDGTRIEY